MSHHNEPQVTVLPPDKEKIKQLWRVALYLLLITMVEFGIAFTLDHGPFKTALFVFLTIVKAGYIVGEFMHLRHEVKVLFWAVLLPMIFIGWMLVAFVYEGTKIIRI
jgi:cytochrome c oxidase subunit IV